MCEWQPQILRYVAHNTTSNWSGIDVSSEPDSFQFYVAPLSDSE